MVLSTAIVTALSVFGAFTHSDVIVIASVIVIVCFFGFGVHTLPGFIVVVVVVVGIVVVVVGGSVVVVVVVGTVIVVTAIVVVGGSWGW